MSLPALFYWDRGGLSVLIPKRRGAGYLKCPLGHHHVEALSRIEQEEHIDLCGLDGPLVLEYGYTTPEDRELIVARVLPKLSLHFGFTTWHKASSSEFFHQIAAR